MNKQIFESGYEAYQKGDWATAASVFAQAKDPGELCGKVDHLRGNALMQLGCYAEAADAYGSALQDRSYGMVGALCTNRGRALVACGKIGEAIESLSTATQDRSYATPYKAYLALGGAYRALGDTRNAGIAYRNAAIDEKNPDPSMALRKLGACFMELGRPSDAVESYRTALDFVGDPRTKNAIYCDLALAYVAANQMSEAVSAFNSATADGTYVLSSQAQASYDAARNAVAARASGRRVSDTDDFLAATGYGAYQVDPLDPTGEASGNLMPSPEDTGFFSISEEEIVNDARKHRKGRVGKVLVAVLIVLLLVAGAGGFAYYSGFGWPMQETVVRGLFDARTNNADLNQYIDASLDDNARKQIEALVPKGATISIAGIDRSMSSSEVRVTATLAEGGERSYNVKLVRSGIGWKVGSFEPAFVSTDSTNVLSTQNTAPGSAEQNNSAAEQQQPVEGQPQEGQPVEGQPQEGQPVEGQPVEGQPQEEQPVEEQALVAEGEGEVPVEEVSPDYYVATEGDMPVE